MAFVGFATTKAEQTKPSAPDLSPATLTVAASSMSMCGCVRVCVWATVSLSAYQWLAMFEQLFFERNKRAADKANRQSVEGGTGGRGSCGQER